MELFKLFGTIMVDNEKANKSIDSTSKEADGLGSKLLNGAKTVGKWAAALGTAAVAAGTAIYGVSKKAADTTDHIDKMSQKLGLSREKYQELDFIMSQSGGSVDGLKKQLKSLDTAIEKSSDSSSDSAKAFDKLGISMTDATGKMKSSDEIFYDTIKGLQGITDSQEKNRIASELLGSKYKELAPLINGTSGSFEEMRQQAHDLGLVINDESIDAGVKLTDTMDQAKRSFDTIITKIGVGFMPVVQGAFDLIIQNMPIIQNVLNIVFGVFNNVINGVAILFNFIKPIIQDLFDKLQIWWNENGNIVITAFKNAVEGLKNVISFAFPIIQGVIETAFDIINTIFNTTLKPVFDTLISNVIPNLQNIFSSAFPLIASFVEAAFNVISYAWKNILKPIFDIIGIVLKTILLPIFKTVFNIITTIVSSAFKGINAVYNSVLKPVFTTITDAIKILQKNFNSIFGAIKNTVASIFGGIKNAMVNPIESAKKLISNIVNTIKGFFGGFKISFPKIPLPHFAVKPKGWGIGDLLKGEIPSLGIDWYAKAMDDGMILDKPTIFGAANGKLLGGGEVGNEVVVGQKSLFNMIHEASESGNNELLKVLNIIADRLSNNNLYNIIVKAIKDGGFIIELDGREVGRIVRRYA